ncbi:MAG: alanine racemase [Clostridiales bacterium]|nr:alanine racemase [Clostridiales bacterium]
MLEADINLATLKDNIAALKGRTNAKFCAVVKSDAYGHGLVRVARAAQEYSDELAVAVFSEAAELADHGITIPINILGPTDFSGFESKTYTMSDIIPTICAVRALNEQAGGFKKVNIKLNTGMNRLGLTLDGLGAVIAELKRRGIKIGSVFTHLYNAANAVETNKQLAVFQKAEKYFGRDAETFHAWASAFADMPPAVHFGMVRPGIALYGYRPYTKPVMSVRTSILQLTDVKAGEHIGYGDYTAPRDTRLAAVRLGYGDGYRRIRDGGDGGRAVAINGVLCPVAGQVCMDVTMVDVGGVRLTGGERVYILGGGVTGQMLAESYGTIIYEVLTSFNPKRIKRNYIE